MKLCDRSTTQKKRQHAMSFLLCSCLFFVVPASARSSLLDKKSEEARGSCCGDCRSRRSTKRNSKKRITSSGKYILVSGTSANMTGTYNISVGCVNSSVLPTAFPSTATTTISILRFLFTLQKKKVPNNKLSEVSGTHRK